MTKILIATYSWSGRTQAVAKKLAKNLENADTYTLEVAPDTFDNDMFETDAIATSQIKSDNYPKLVNKIPDISNYDLILVGSPVWRGAPATPVHTFLEEIKDYSGKVASFYTDAGSAGSYEETFRKWAHDLNVVGTHEGSANDLVAWVKGLS